MYLFWMYTLRSFDKCIHLCNHTPPSRQREFLSSWRSFPVKTLSHQGSHYSDLYHHTWDFVYSRTSCKWNQRVCAFCIWLLLLNMFLRFIFVCKGFTKGRDCEDIDDTDTTDHNLRILELWVSGRKAEWRCKWHQFLDRGKVLYTRPSCTTPNLKPSMGHSHGRYILEIWIWTSAMLAIKSVNPFNVPELKLPHWKNGNDNNFL